MTFFNARNYVVEYMAEKNLNKRKKNQRQKNKFTRIFSEFISLITGYLYVNYIYLFGACITSNIDNNMIFVMIFLFLTLQKYM